MAEVFAAFGTVSAFLQVVEFIAKLASKAYDLSRANRDSLREDIELERLAREYRSIAEECLNAVTRPCEAARHQQIIKLGQECQREAQKLLDELDSIRVEACGSKLKRVIEGTRVAARVLARQKAIDNQRRRLQELNTLLATQMLQDLWKHNASQISICTRDPTSMGAENVDTIRLIVARKRIHHVLESLCFDEMDLREQTVKQAWPKTYSWTLDDDSSHGFSTWLLRDHGMFWISGKAGSGKSTLMKYLYSHERTKKVLLQWSGNRQLILARFFFWYAGSSLQHSINGLLRSILYQILYEVPALAQVAFPTHADGKISAEWTDDELLHALVAITHNKGAHMAAANKVFCFFVDGLDEYEGEHGNLTELLMGFDKCLNLKMCISSRPWNAFRSAFNHNIPKLRLEDLTKSDIVQYTSDKMRSSMRTHAVFQSAGAGTGDLIRDIADRAEGVFLWVILAVKSVCQGISEGDDVAFLRYRVQSFPRDLEAFFRDILERVDPIYKHQTYQALKLAWIFARNGKVREESDDERAGHRPVLWNARDSFPGTWESRASVVHHGKNPKPKDQLKILSSFIDFWLIRQNPRGLEGTTFAYEGDVGDISQQLFDQMNHETVSFLSATCRDLLCLEPAPSQNPYHFQVEFLHRTVYDFLNTPDMQKMLDERVPEHFKSSRILHLLNLKRLKYSLPYADLTVRTKLLADSTAMSLTSAHPDLCEEYARQFDRISLRHLPHLLKSPIWSRKGARFASADVLATFIAFGQRRYCSKVLSEGWSQMYTASADLKTLCQYRPNLPSEGFQVWAATLGESPLNPFSFQHVNFEFVELLLRVSTKLTVCHEFPNTICLGWRVFLNKWKFADPPSFKDPSSRSSKWRQVWELAKLFLNHGAPLYQSFGIESSSKQSGYSRYTAEDHILGHVPRNWLEECSRFGIVEGEIEQVEGSQQRGIQHVKTEAAVSRLNRSRLQFLNSFKGDIDDPIPIDEEEGENHDGE